MEAAHAKMRKKNEILPRLQERFEAALQEGKLLGLTQGAGDWIDELVQEIV